MPIERIQSQGQFPIKVDQSILVLPGSVRRKSPSEPFQCRARTCFVPSLRLAPGRPGSRKQGSSVCLLMLRMASVARARPTDEKSDLLGNGAITKCSVRLVLKGGLGNRGCRGWYYSSRGHREHNPKNDVSKKACPGKENGQQPHDAHDRGIKVKIVCQTGAHAGNLLVGARAHQFLLATCLRRKAWRWSFRLLGAAVVAKP